MRWGEGEHKRADSTEAISHGDRKCLAAHSLSVMRSHDTFVPQCGLRHQQKGFEPRTEHNKNADTHQCQQSDARASKGSDVQLVCHEVL